MRLLHTSDWHLGRSFHGVSLLEEQAAAISRIAELAREHAVDAVLIAGDLYDRAIPPAEAVALFNDALARLSAGGTAVVAIAGNHDSHVRVSVYDPLLSAFNITVRGDVGRAQEPVLVTPRAGGTPVAIYPLPYLEPAVVGPALAGAPVRLRHEEVTRLAIERIHADRRERPPHRSVLVAHTFVAGGETSESERELTIGNVDRVSVAAFEGFDYVALGHLHASQQLDGPRIAYSGTPLAYSFSEEHHVKSVRIVELAADGTPTVQVVPLEVGRPLCTLRGPIDELCGAPRHAAASEARVRAILTDDSLPLQAMARLRARFPHIAELRHEPPELARAGEAERHRQVRQARSPLQLATAFFTDQHGQPPGEPEAELLRAALAAAERGGER
ncbi:exonuclease SbcCD subunit D [Synechococcus sp. Lug-A]|uniref:exonuclease SbcCD subunit D n=1 Tax=Synechococcus sp. Lug-A TaxID=2823740 RepID=UPI0020CD4129|nr:exonuclease SbcCD subunit D [Synechococcus sp. Lug-A]MCP9846043.1 exonuclease SbcCD subunit D [Synechococcus sp. Lug-A]